MNNNENKNLDIDSLLDDVLLNDSSTPTEFEENRIKSPKEVAQKELFEGMPTTVDLDVIDQNLGIKPRKKKSKKEPVAQQNPNIVQEALDLNAAPKNYYKMEETESKNYKKMLSKLIKSSDVVTSEFVSNVADESGLVEEGKETGTSDDNSELKSSIVIQKEQQATNNTISMRSYSPKTAIDDRSDFVFINKALFATLGATTLLALIETFVMYFIINAINPIHRVFYYIAALIAIIPLGVGIFTYALNPNKAVNRKFNYISYLLNSLIITVVLAVLLIVIVLLTSVSLTDPVDYVPKVVLPALFILDYPISIGFYAIFTKTKLFHVGE